MRPRAFHTLTLGCKLNRFDSAVIESELARRGFRSTDEVRDADIVVVNTCTVTGKADAEARKIVRRVRRENPGCRLLVTGCYAELDPAALAAVEHVDAVFGNRDKGRVGEILDGMGLRDERPLGTDPDRGCEAAAGLRFGERGRAYLKVQEGCDLRCSYCVIPRARGASRSVPEEEVVRGLLELGRAGYREVVLTGINTGDWGRDLDPPRRLDQLLRHLLDDVGPHRIRLNSLEPLTVTPEVVALIASDPRLAPHLQVPLQSGSDRILRLMRRNYRAAQYLDRVGRLRAAVPDAAIGADVIVGFPGETEALFEETVRFVEASPLDYLHVFAWSPREGTDASSLPGRPPPVAVQERSARLRALGRERFLQFRQRFVGRALDAVMLGEAGGARRARALTGNFIETTVEAPAPAARQPVLVRIERIDGPETFAIVAGQPSWASIPS